MIADSASTHIKDVFAAVESHTFPITEREAVKLADPVLKRLKAAPAPERIEFVREAMRRLPEANFAVQLALKGMAAALLRGETGLTGADALDMVRMGAVPRLIFPYRALLAALERVEITPALRDALRQMRDAIDDWHGGTDRKDLHARIDALLAGNAEPAAGATATAVAVPLQPAGLWTRTVFAEIAALPNAAAWRALFQHAQSLEASTAPKKWQSEAVQRIEQAGRAEFVERARRWLALGPLTDAPNGQTPEADADYQKGFLWALGALGDTSIAPEIADFALACFRKIPMVGAVSQRVGNACVNALAVMPGLGAVSQLSRLAAKVKYDVARRLIEKALSEAAARNGVSRDDLEAMSVPDFGLSAGGVRTEVAGDCTATLRIDGGAAHLDWSRHGKPLKSLPAEVKQQHAELAAGLKKQAKELSAVLDAQRFRLERQLLSQSSCSFARWEQWYGRHPVVSHLATRLIWEVGAAGATAIWRGGRFEDWAGNAVAAEADSPVRLWHPIRSAEDVQTVLSWRCWLEDNSVTQPFKQAHREIYVLTEAERQTGTFSNRFAAHIIGQHQFAALCRERGWQFNLMGMWDSHNTPYLDLPQYGIRAEFDVDSDGHHGQAPAVSGHAIYLTVRTGQVRFRPLAEKPSEPQVDFLAALRALQTPEALAGLTPAALRLETVPPVVFSEVMRDCDLFVGVASIGADPAWTTRARPEDPHLAYWHEFAQAELGLPAESRKAVLERLIPKLAIADRCRIEGRYLEVRGDLHRYRIHLGSGNVMIEPGSRYLCIVQGPGDTAARIALPFDGDRMLSMILSKAMLLANDTAIKDPAIVSQLRTR